MDKRRCGAGRLRAAVAKRMPTPRHGVHRCEARTRRGHALPGPGRGRGDRCRLHGGASIGPTAEEVSPSTGPETKANAETATTTAVAVNALEPNSSRDILDADTEHDPQRPRLPSSNTRAGRRKRVLRLTVRPVVVVRLCQTFDPNIRLCSHSNQGDLRQ